MGTFTMSRAAFDALAAAQGAVIINISATLHYGATWYQVGCCPVLKSVSHVCSCPQVCTCPSALTVPGPAAALSTLALTLLPRAAPLRAPRCTRRRQRPQSTPSPARSRWSGASSACASSASRRGRSAAPRVRSALCVSLARARPRAYSLRPRRPALSVRRAPRSHEAPSPHPTPPPPKASPSSRPAATGAPWRRSWCPRCRWGASGRSATSRSPACSSRRPPRGAFSLSLCVLARAPACVVRACVALACVFLASPAARRVSACLRARLPVLRTPRVLARGRSGAGGPPRAPRPFPAAPHPPPCTPPPAPRSYVSGETLVVDGASWLHRPPLVPRGAVSALSRKVESKSRAVGVAGGSGGGGVQSKL